MKIKTVSSNVICECDEVWTSSIPGDWKEDLSDFCMTPIWLDKGLERYFFNFSFKSCLWTDLCLNWHILITVFLLQILDYHQFYLALDNEFLADRIKSLVGFLGANWRRLGRPILTMIITHSMLGRLSWQLTWHLTHH